MKIRKALAKDKVEIARLMQKYLGKDYKPIKITPDFIEKKMRQKSHTYFVAEDNKKVIGVIRASIEDIDLADLRTLVVDEKHRRRGAAAELIKYSLGYLKARKMRKVIVKTKSDNKIAIKLVKGLGFKQEGYFKDHYRKGTDIIQFAKFLKRIRQ